MIGEKKCIWSTEYNVPRIEACMYICTYHMARRSFLSGRSDLVHFSGHENLTHYNLFSDLLAPYLVAHGNILWPHNIMHGFKFMLVSKWPAAWPVAMCSAPTRNLIALWRRGYCIIIMLLHNYASTVCGAGSS